jgi:hypothetical protein
MTRKCALFLAVFVALSLPSLLGEEPVPLPVRNVELYKNGMAFSSTGERCGGTRRWKSPCPAPS